MASNSNSKGSSGKRGPTRPVHERAVETITKMGVGDINTFAGNLVKTDPITAEYLHTQLTSALVPAVKEA